MQLSKAAIKTILRLSAAAVIGGTFVAINLLLRETRDPKTLCLPDGGRGQTIVLIDKTDKWNLIQSDRLEKHVLRILEKEVKQEERVRVFAFGSSFVPGFEEKFGACKPPDGHDCSGLFCSPKKLKEQYQAVFQSPLLAELDTLKIATYGNCSPIAEVLFDVMSRVEIKNQSGPTRVVLISDMAQNTPIYTTFKGSPTCPGVSGKTDPDKDKGLQAYFDKQKALMRTKDASVLVFRVVPDQQLRPAETGERAQRKWTEVFKLLGFRDGWELL